jgi:hypothetical protein
VPDSVAKVKVSTEKVADGFAVADGIAINGVRAFDSNLGAWSTPDAFEGDIHDPASQQKYMWNRGECCRL